MEFELTKLDKSINIEEKENYLLHGVRKYNGIILFSKMYLSSL